MTIRELSYKEWLVKLTFSTDNGAGKSEHSYEYILNVDDDWTLVREALEHDLYMQFEKAVILGDPESCFTGADVTELFLEPEETSMTPEDIANIYGNTCDYSGICSGPSCPDYQYCILQGGA